MKKLLNGPFKVGDLVNHKNIGDAVFEILKIEDDVAFIKDYHRLYEKEKVCKIADLTYSKPWIGINPFKKIISLEEMPSQLSSISLWNENNKTEEKIKELNFDPTVNVDGKDIPYQRGYVWNLQDKQNLIYSIYNQIDCGKIVLKENHVNELYAKGKGFFYDVIDGKQRLSTIIEFLEDEFCDSEGNYFSQFSKASKRGFLSLRPFKIMKMKPESNDKEVLEQFLITNFAGVPQSAEHMEYVKALYFKD